MPRAGSSISGWAPKFAHFCGAAGTHECACAQRGAGWGVGGQHALFLPNENKKDNVMAHDWRQEARVKLEFRASGEGLRSSSCDVLSPDGLVAWIGLHSCGVATHCRSETTPQDHRSSPTTALPHSTSTRVNRVTSGATLPLSANRIVSTSCCYSVRLALGIPAHCVAGGGDGFKPSNSSFSRPTSGRPLPTCIVGGRPSSITVPALKSPSRHSHPRLPHKSVLDATGYHVLTV